MAFICERLKLNCEKLSDEEKKWLKKIAEKSNLLKIQTHSGEERERVTNCSLRGIYENNCQKRYSNYFINKFYFVHVLYCI